LHYKRIEIAVKPELEDPFTKHIKWEISSTLGFQVREMRIVSVYTVYSDLSDDQLRSYAEEVLSDPVLTIYSVGAPLALQLPAFRWALEVSYKPGVTDNVGHTAHEVLAMMMGMQGSSEYRVYKSTQYLLDSDAGYDQVKKIGSEILYNGLIEEISIHNYREFAEAGGQSVSERSFKKDYSPETVVLNLHVSDGALKRLSEERMLALSLAEMKYFRAYFDQASVQIERKKLGIGIDPTDVELEVFAQTQSEHCKHKIFNAAIEYRENGKKETITSIFQTYIKSATEKISKEKDFLVSVFKDNAGIIRFSDEYNLAFKVETHNSPSALDPYGGAITGIVGCDRDPAGTGLGSRIIAHTDVLCFGDPAMTGKLPPRMMHPKRIMQGVIKGIEDGGNKCGIPTVNGGVIFDQSYSGKPLVFCGSVGIMPARIAGRPTHEKEAKPGDAIVMAGGRIGKDGIHGATFSSEEISETSPAQAVQIGDPITQKKMLDMLIEARDRLLYRGITDNGAGGLSSSVGEMALFSNGAYLELEKAPLKYSGLDPWEILLSEAQERMTLAVPRENLKEFLSLARRRDVLAVPIGEFTDSGYFHVAYNGKTVCYLELKFLHSQIPLSLEAEWRNPDTVKKPPAVHVPLSRVVMEMISDFNACSREPIIRRYDHEVGGNTVVKPLVGTHETGPSDGGVIAPIPGSRLGFVLTAGINPFYSTVDTYAMAALAVDEAIRNAIAVGADPDRIALLDNFCWPDPVYDREKTPDGRLKLAQLVRAARGLHDTAVSYGTPFISGKDSMKNDYKIGGHKVSVLPTILISAIGVVPDITHCVTSDFKFDNDSIYLIGKTGRHLGASFFYRKYGGQSTDIPAVDMVDNKKVYKKYHELIKRGLLASGHDCSEGGLALALAESCIGGDLGAEIDRAFLNESSFLTTEELLFSESSGRFLVSVNPLSEDEFISIVKDIPCTRIGTTNNSRELVIREGSTVLVSIGIDELTEAYRNPLYNLLGMQK